MAGTLVSASGVQLRKSDQPDLQGIVNVRSPAIRHVIRHRRFQKRQCALVFIIVLSIVRCCGTTRFVLKFFSVVNVRSASQKCGFCAPLALLPVKVCIPHQFTRVTVLYSGGHCRAKWRDAGTSPLISGRGVLRINIPTAIPLLRLLQKVSNA